MQGLAAFQLLQVKNGKRLDGARRWQALGGELLAHVPDRKRVDRELTTADHHWENPGGGTGSGKFAGCGSRSRLAADAHS